MKKIILLLVMLLPVVGFSQSNRERIQAYLYANHASLGLTRQDVSDFVLKKEVYSEGTKITSCYITQRHLGTEIFNAESNVWIKDGKVVNIANNFIPAIAQKVNASTPGMSVIQGITSAYSRLNINVASTFSIVETIDSRTFKLNDGLQEDFISAQLVYQNVENNSLKLAWAFQFYAPNGTELWDLRIDAGDGRILQQNNLTLNCVFGDANHDAHNHTSADYSFADTAIKHASSSIVDINSGSYRVIPYNYISPNHSPFQLITTPHDPTASPHGWHDTNNAPGAEFTITRGNNVWAIEDADNNDSGTSPNGGAGLVFDFPYGGSYVQPATYVNAATTNLFYMNNIMHDVWYKYGFNEASGNFQQNNYGNGGVPSFQGDAVNAQAQDSRDVAAAAGNRNNANFSTPNDGQRPRMQMYLWTIAPTPEPPLTILSPADIAGPRAGTDNVFNPGHVPLPVAPNMIQSDLVLYDDGTPDIGQTDNADGCGPAVNAAAINGHIAVIRRSVAEAAGGTPCAFAIKVKNAQNAGATAVIIVNNVTDPASISMSGADATITIPAISVTQAIGEALIARMKIETVNAKIQVSSPPFVSTDGSFDNGIVAHEYGHGISNRLIGATASCMTNYEQMGEGWSDWFSLMMQIKSGDNGATGVAIGTYAANQPNDGGGIRTPPWDNGYLYSTDMAVNPHTLVNSNQEIPVDPADTSYRYTTGKVWAAVLWDLTWAYINKYGYDADIYNGTGGNNKVMKLVLDALKLQACNTASIISSRDNLIAADQFTTGGADYCMITEVFRRRGMGLNATSGSANNPNDQVEDFTAFPAGPNCLLAVDHFSANDMIKVYPNPSNGLVTVRINQFSGKVNLQVIDINGRIVYSSTDANFNNQTTINLDHLQSGVYVLKVNGDELNYTHKLILN